MPHSKPANKVPECLQEMLNTYEQFSNQQATSSDALWWSENNEVLQALITDDNMSEVYQIMEDEHFSKDQIRDFIIIAWSARNVFSGYRDRVRMANDVRKSAIRAAKRLQELIRELRDTGVYLPPELLHPDNFDEPFAEGRSDVTRDLLVLRWFKAMEDWGLDQAPATEATPPTTTESQSSKRRKQSKDKDRTDDSPIGGHPPDVIRSIEDSVVAPLEKLNTDFMSLHIKDKTITRQTNDKMDYLRSFIQSLIGKSYAWNSNLENAIAKMANVALCIPPYGLDNEVSVADVRAARRQIMSSNGA